ncbi:hypothetical protein SCUCBS95973_003302 [Sporothrix curviconia]|uniref:FAD dependent oxidoreductase domain-containing protein n=1 Tax=Sporothrix curviconia TaxID=1260050 RepID=A0ABP0BFG6_9PEZI
MATAPPKNVVVVGAGIVGASIAWHLAVLGAQVTVITSEAEIAGGTATPNSFAWINANRGNARHYYELRRRSMARWRTLADVEDKANGSAVPGLAGLLRWTGAIQWTQQPEALDVFVDEHTRWGYYVARIDNAELAEREPALSESALPPAGGAVETPHEGSVEPALAAQLLLEQATAVYGARVLVATTATAVTVSAAAGKQVTGVATADGQHLAADHVVVAAGLGSVPLLATAGVGLPVYGRPGLLAHSRPVLLPHHRRLLNGIVLSAGPHVRQTLAGRLLVGADFAGGWTGNGDGRRSLTDLDADEQRQAGVALLEEAKKLFRPEDAALVELDFVTVGHRPQPRDGLPIVDANVLPGLAVAVMHSGVTLAPIVGDLLAKAIVEGEVDKDLEAFGLKRFGDTAAQELA